MKTIIVFALITIAACKGQSTCPNFNDTQHDTGRIATYEEIVDLPQKPEVLLIDVRQPEELEQEGKIPTAINIPCEY